MEKEIKLSAPRTEEDTKKKDDLKAVEKATKIATEVYEEALRELENH